MTKRKTIRDIGRQKEDGQRIVCLTAYTAPFTQIADRHADLLLVGDSVGMVLYGFESTVPVTLEMMIAHGAAVMRASRQALVVVDMPFGSYQASPAQAFENAARILKETGCAAVKIEGGAEMAETVSFLTQRGVAVMGHVGLQPQSVHGLGGYRVLGRDEAEKKKIIADAKAIEAAGAFSIVLECVSAALVADIMKAVKIPVIGIGASALCDGQILVSDDLLNLTPGPHAKFVKHYADLAGVIDGALRDYAREVRGGAFPSEDFVYQNIPRRPAEAAE